MTETIAGTNAETVAGTEPETVAEKVAGNSYRQPLPIRPKHRPLIQALRAAGRPLNVTELAHAMGCSVAESSRRVDAAKSVVKTKRSGRCKFVSLSPTAIIEDAPPALIGNDSIYRALRSSDRPLTVTELARVMRCSVEQSTKRVKAAKQFLLITRVGRKNVVSMRDLDRQSTLDFMKTLSPNGYWWHPPK